MSDLQDLLGVDHEQTFEFFVSSLQDQTHGQRVDEDEMLYIARVLAHFVQVSRYNTEQTLTMTGLSEVFDKFIIERPISPNSELFENAGSQVILFVGFFRDQVRNRHNVEWYDKVGSSLYFCAAQYTRDFRKREFFEGMAEAFPVWTKVCSKMSRSLRTNRYIIGRGPSFS
jgi:hypothetical protein